MVGYMKRIRLKLIIILKGTYWSPIHIRKLPRTRSKKLLILKPTKHLSLASQQTQSIKLT